VKRAARDREETYGRDQLVEKSRAESEKLQEESGGQRQFFWGFPREFAANEPAYRKAKRLEIKKPVLAFEGHRQPTVGKRTEEKKQREMSRRSADIEKNKTKYDCERNAPRRVERVFCSRCCQFEVRKERG
jgi:hypothetical protein